MWQAMYRGSIEVIAGCMFSGKTEELLRCIRRAEIARLPVQLFKHGIDNRYTAGHVESHSSMRLPASGAVTVAELRTQLNPQAHVIGIDEAQFYEPSIVDFVTELANRGRQVILAGLPTDFRGVPFGPMPQLMAVADNITMLHAVCMVCGNPATCNQRLVASQEVIMVGAKDSYEARCRQCFRP